MEETQDIIAELAAITAEMAEMQDIGGKKLSDLLERRGELIRKLIAGRFDPGDGRLALIIADADQLQERLRTRADLIRHDLSSLQATEALMRAVQSTINAPKESELNVSA